MKIEISSAAHAACQLAGQHGIAVKRTSALQIIAALLGYGSYQALCIEEASPQLDLHLGDAEVYVLNQSLADARCGALGLDKRIAEACVHAAKKHFRKPVYLGVDEFWWDYARDELAVAIYNDEATVAAMGETNAEFDLPDLDEPDVSGDLWSERTTWTIGATGTLQGEHNFDDDLMFAGDELDVSGKLVFSKAGRGGLVFREAEAGASVVDDWRE